MGAILRRRPGSIDIPRRLLDILRHGQQASHHPLTGMASTAADGPQTVGFLLVPGFALMSYAAAVEPLRAANLISGKELYRWWHAAPRRQAGDGLQRPRHHPRLRHRYRSRRPTWCSSAPAAIPAIFDDKSVFAWLRRLARKGVAIGGISGGPYVLAKAGLLDQRRATLHWEHLPAFREAFPDIAVVPSLFEIDGNRITCSGGISALDMMVALIERDHGRQLAAAVGDWFLHTHIREGFGPQRMDLRYRLGVADEKLLARAARHGDQHRDAAAPRGARRARPASRSASSSGCSSTISAAASTATTAASGWSGPASSCARPPSPCSTWRSPPALPRRASSPAPIGAPSASRRARPASSGEDPSLRRSTFARNVLGSA